MSAGNTLVMPSEPLIPGPIQVCLPSASLFPLRAVWKKLTSLYLATVFKDVVALKLVHLAARKHDFFSSALGGLSAVRFL